MKVDRFYADVRVEGVLVEENRTARKVGHVKTFMQGSATLQPAVSQKRLPCLFGAQGSSCEC